MRRPFVESTRREGLDPIDQRIEADRLEQVERVLRPWQLGIHDRLRRDLAQPRSRSTHKER
jgi:hypothetical protein